MRALREIGLSALLTVVSEEAEGDVGHDVGWLAGRGSSAAKRIDFKCSHHVGTFSILFGGRRSP